MAESFDPEHTLRSERLVFQTEVVAEQQAESGDRLNEDAFVLAQDDDCVVAGVFDGASAISSVTGHTSVSETTGRFAALRAAQSVETDFKKADCAKVLLLGANRAVAETLAEKGVVVEDKNALELSNSQGLVVRIDKKRGKVDVALLGDAACLVRYKGGKVELAVPVDFTPEDAQALNLAVTISRSENISLKQALASRHVNDLFVRGRSSANDPSGRGVGALDGRKSAEGYVRAKSFNAGELEEIILLSDGMFLPTEDPNKEPDWQKMADIAHVAGIKGLYEEVLSLKSTDPDLGRYPRAKKHDDATGILIKF